MTVADSFPENMQDDVRFIVLKYGSPGLVRDVLFSEQIPYESSLELNFVLLDLYQSTMSGSGWEWEDTAISRWIDNIHDYLRSHVKISDAPPRDARPRAKDCYRPDLARPADFHEVLDDVAIGEEYIVVDGFLKESTSDRFPDGDPWRPPRRIAAVAAAHPNGWVTEIDDPAQPFRPERVRGRWRVGNDGRVSAYFDPNPDYRPPGVEPAQ